MGIFDYEQEKNLEKDLENLFEGKIRVSKNELMDFLKKKEEPKKEVVPVEEEPKNEENIEDEELDVKEVLESPQIMDRLLDEYEDSDIPKEIKTGHSQFIYGGGGGENNLMSNVGDGVGIYKDKVGSNLRIKSLVEGNSISIIDNEDSITISSPFSGVSLSEITTSANDYSMPVFATSSDSWEPSTTQWDDLRVSSLSTSELGSNSPSIKLFKSSDAITSGNSIEQDSNSQAAQSITSGDVVGLGSDMTLAFWINADSFTGTQTILTIGTFYVEWRFSDNIRIGGYGGSSHVEGSVIKGQRTFVVFTFESTGGNSYTAKLYINNSEVDDDSFTDGSLPDNSTNTLELFGDNFRGRLDALAFYSSVFGLSDVASQYNGGNGLSIVGDELSLIYGWNFDEGTGTTASEVNGEPVEFIGVDAWGDGIVTTQSSKGVVVRAFNSSIEEEVYFEVQMPHSWKEGTIIYPHVHWVPLSSATSAESNVSWGLEYTWSNINELFDDTNIISNNVTMSDGSLIADNHYVTILGAIDGTGKKISSMILCRLFRDATGVLSEDNYTGLAGLLEFDIHYQSDSFGGSRQEFIK